MAFLKERGLIDDAYLVGGAVRDILLSKGLKDIDIALKGDVVKLAKDFSRAIDATCVTLDEELSVVRVVKGQQWLDLSRLRCDSIFIDLSERDLTINAMAIPLKGLDDIDKSLIDIYNGLEDLRQGVIRMVSEENFIKDPLRIVRVFRFAATLDFSIDPKTLQTVNRLAGLISSVAYERVTEELRMIISVPKSSEVLKSMLQCKVLTHIFAIPFSEASMVVYTKVEDLITGHSSPFCQYTTMFQKQQRLFPLKLASLLHNLSGLNALLKQLRLSKKEQDIITKIFEHRGRFEELYTQTGLNLREVAMFFLNLGIDALCVMIIDLASYTDEDGGFLTYTKEVLCFYEDQYKRRLPLLSIINGDKIMASLNLQPSALIKTLLNHVHVRILAGEIDSYDEAIKVASDIYEKEILTKSTDLSNYQVL